MISNRLYCGERLCKKPKILRPPLRLIKRHERGGSSVPIIIDGKVLLHEKDSIYCYREDNFDLLWKTKKNHKRDVPLIVGDEVYVDDCSREGNVVSYNLSSGQENGRFSGIPDTAWASNVNFIYVAEYHGKLEDRNKRKVLTCRERNLDTVWRYDDFRFNEFSISNNHVILTDLKGNIVCLGADNGRELWRIGPMDTGLFKNEAEIKALPDRRKGRAVSNLKVIGGSPVIFGDLAVVQMFGNHLMGVELATGDVAWVREVEHTTVTCRSAYCHEIYTATNVHIEAFDMRTGEQTRLIKVDPGLVKERSGSNGINFGHFTVSESHVFVSGYIRDYFCSVNKDSGVADWLFVPDETRHLIHSGSYPHIAHGRLYLPTLEDTYVFEGADGYLPNEE